MAGDDQSSKCGTSSVRPFSQPSRRTSRSPEALAVARASRRRLVRNHGRRQLAATSRYRTDVPSSARPVMLFATTSTPIIARRAEPPVDNSCMNLATAVSRFQQIRRINRVRRRTSGTPSTRAIASLDHWRRRRLLFSAPYRRLINGCVGRRRRWRRAWHKRPCEVRCGAITRDFDNDRPANATSS